MAGAMRLNANMNKNPLTTTIILFAIGDANRWTSSERKLTLTLLRKSPTNGIYTLIIGNKFTCGDAANKRLQRAGIRSLSSRACRMM
jgi:hypothetical protein